jgi:hypothetical protein
MAKDKGKGKGKRKDAKASPNDWPLINVAQHPRARTSINRSKAWAGLIAFVVVAIFSWKAGVEPVEVGVRAIGAGIAAYVVIWAAAVALWQRLIVAEAKATAERRRDERMAHLREVSGS